MKPLDSLALNQIERRLRPLRKQIDTTKVRRGWIHYIRTALGMSLKDLALKSKSKVPTVAQAERREVEGKVTVETLRKMAAAMECEFIYAFVPREEIHAILKENARNKAKKILIKTNTHMTLEDQEVRENMQIRIERLANKLIQDGDVW